MSGIRTIQEHGQSVWYDYIQRSLITTGALHRMIEQDGLRGVTSNPAIFQKAIAGSNDYRGALKAAIARGLDAPAIFEEIAVSDIQLTADTLAGVYESTHKQDGYVSLEVSPHLAHDQAATIAEAKRLWRAVGRDNLMIKVPATPEGVGAIQTLIAEGINVNVTLLFAVEAYEAVAEAYLAGLEKRLAANQPIDHVASVASFFVSRIDTLVDKRIDERLASLQDAGLKKTVEGLKGKIAIANAKRAYKSYQSLVSTPRWKKLKDAGAQVQRLLWASTSTKNPTYRDVLYVEELIGPDTVNTIPEATFHAFNDHGVAEPRLLTNIDEALADLEALSQADISMVKVTDELLEDGVVLFAKAFDGLLGTIEAQRSK